MPYVQIAHPGIEQITRLLQMAHKEPDHETRHGQVVAVAQQELHDPPKWNVSNGYELVREPLDGK